MTHLFDTDTCIGILRQRSRIVARLNQLSPRDCCVSEITAFELFCGVEKLRIPEGNASKLNSFLEWSLNYRSIAPQPKLQPAFEWNWRGKAIGLDLTMC